MNVLVIDNYDDHFHDQFNEIHIKALATTNNNIIIAGKKNHYGFHIEKSAKKVINIPDYLYCKRYTSGYKVLLSRVADIIRLLYLKRILKKTNIDRIVFLRYDIITIPFFVTKKIVYLINHQTANDIENSIKNKILCKLPKNYVHIALNDGIKEYIKSKISNKEVITIPHGLLSPFKLGNKNDFEYFYKDKIIFCSTTSSLDTHLLRQIVESEKVSQYLIQQKINFYIKSNQVLKESKNIKPLKGFIKKDEYQWLIKNSIAVFLPYNRSFGYRVSGIFFECITNNTPVISSNINAFHSYTNKRQPIFCIDNDVDFINAIKSILNETKGWDKSDFDPIPYWNNILR